MRQAIRTKYLGPTPTKPSRVKAWCEAGSVTIPWNPGVTADQNYLEAFYTLVEKLDWTYTRWVYGYLDGAIVAVCDED